MLSNEDSFRRKDVPLWLRVAETELLEDADREVYEVFEGIEVSLTIIFKDVLWNNRFQVGMG